MPPERHNPPTRPKEPPLAGEAGEAGALHGHQAGPQQEVGRVGVKVLGYAGPLYILPGELAAGTSILGGLPGWVGHETTSKTELNNIVKENNDQWLWLTGV